MEIIRILKNPMIMVPYILSAMIALFWPNREIEIPILTDFLKLIIEHVPSVHGYATKSKFPYVSGFYFSFSSILFLPCLIYYLRNKGSSFGSIEKMEKLRLKVQQKTFPRLFSLFAILFVVAMLYGAWIQTGYQFSVVPVNEKRWALAVIGPFGSVFLWHIFA